VFGRAKKDGRDGDALSDACAACASSSKKRTLEDSRLRLGFDLAPGRDIGSRGPDGTALALEARALGRDHADLAAPLTGIGKTYLDEAKSELARAPLIRALPLREANAGDPYARGETRFALARALPKSASERARGLAVKARAELVSAGPRGVARSADMTQWLSTRR
jgi:hypothetical protein